MRVWIERQSWWHDNVGSKLLGALLIAVAVLVLAPAMRALANDDYEAYVVDDGGPDDQPGQKDLNSLAVDYSHIDTQNTLWVKWTWDVTSASGANTVDACQSFDSDGDGFANYMLCAIWQGSQQQLASSPVLYVCNDSDTDNCGGASTRPVSAGTTCTITNVPDAFGSRSSSGPHDDTVNDTQAECSINLSDVDNGKLTNVCSYPSGQPTSDPSDCVFQPNTTAFLQIAKNAGGDTTTAFNFALAPAARDGSTAFVVTGGETSLPIRITSGTVYQLSEGSLPAGWQLDGATCTVNGQTIGAFAGSTLSGINIATGQTVLCTFTNSLQPAKIIVVKQTTPDGAPTSFTFTPSWNGGATFALSDGQQHDSGFLAPGTYSVSEAPPAGWSQTSATCSDGSAPAQIQLSAGETVTCTFENALLPSAIGVDKTADQSSVSAGSLVTYQYVVTNQGQTPLSNVTVSDDQCSPVTPVENGGFNVGDSDQDNFLEVGEQWQFSCATSLSIDTLNTATAQGDNPVGNAVTATDTAFVDVLPTISVTKTANPTSVPETGANVQFTVQIVNTSGEAVTLSTLSDTIFGNLNGVGACALPKVLAANGGSYTCNFAKLIAGDFGGPNHQNTVTATATDDENNTATAADDAVVSFTDVLPAVDLTKTVTPTAPEPGGVFTFTLAIHNPSDETVTITALTDSYSLPAACTNLVNTTIAPQGSVSCVYTVNLTAPGVYNNVANVTVRDDENNPASDSDDATATVTNVPSSITVSKTASPTSLTEPGGAVQFTVRVTNTSAVDTVTLTTITDDVDNNGVDDVSYNAVDICDSTVLPPDGVAVCTFANNVSGNARAVITDKATVNGVDDDQQIISDSDTASVAILDVNSSLVVSKSANPTSVPEPGADVVFTVQVTNTSAVDLIAVDHLLDSVFNDVTTSGHDGISATTCSVTQVLAANGGNYTCQFTAHVSGNYGDDHENTIVATGFDDDFTPFSAADDAQVAITNVPSSIAVSKTANPTQVPESGGDVTYTVVVANTSTTDPVTIDEVMDDIFGDVSSSCTPALPATLNLNETLACTFTRFVQGNAGTTHVNTITASGYDDEEDQVSGADDAVVTFTDTPAVLTVTKTANPAVVPESGGDVEYTVVIQNESVVDEIGVNSVLDDRFGDIRTECTPALPVTLVPGAAIACTFTRFVQGDIEEQHVNTVTASGVDDDNNNLSARDDAVVTFSDLPSAMTVSKTPSVNAVPAAGAEVTFSVRVENTSVADSLTLHTLTDSIYGTITDANNAALTQTDCAVPQAIAAGQAYECSFSALIAGNIGDQHTNVITAQATDDDEATLSEQDDATVLVSGPIFEATKQDALIGDTNHDGIANPGELIEYTIVIRNTGNAAGAATFSDQPGVNTKLVEGTVTTSQGVVTDGNQAGATAVAVETGAIAPQTAVTIKFQVRINNPLAAGVTKVVNQGRVSSTVTPTAGTDDPDTPTPGDPTETPVVASLNLSAIKTDKLLVDADQNGVASPGDTLEYRITIANNGNQTATGVGLADTPDTHTKLVVGSVQTSAGTVTVGNGAGDKQVQVAIGSLQGGASAIVTFQVTINNPLLISVTQVANQGLITSTELPPVDTDDPDTEQPGDPTVTPVSADPVLTASKRVSLFTDQDKNDFASPSDTLLYEIVIRNTGNAPASGLLFEDTVDANTRLVANSVQTSHGTVLGGNAAGDGTVRVDIGGLAANDQVVITYRVTINNPLPPNVEEVVNQGLLGSNELPDVPTDDPTQPGDEDPTVEPVGVTPQIRVTKADRLLIDADDIEGASAGDTLLYVITVVNSGNGAADQVVLNDTPDVHTELVQGTVQTSVGTVTTGNKPGDKTVSVTIGTMPAGATVTIAFHVTIGEDADLRIANQGTVSFTSVGAGNDVQTPKQSDDPDTPEAADPTVTPIVKRPTNLEPGKEPATGQVVTVVYLPVVQGD